MQPILKMRDQSSQHQKYRHAGGRDRHKICCDDVFEITGSATIKFNNGVVVRFEVVDPLIKKVACLWLSDGSLHISINRVSKIDYDFPHNGDCDNNALLTWNDGNSERVILLP